MEPPVLSRSRVTQGSTYRLLPTGAEALDTVVSAIHEAQKSVRFETYIYQPGEIGEKVRGALVAVAQRGVQVQVLVDAFGSLYLSNSFWDPLRQAGGEVAWFNPLSLGRATYRDHRKLLVCDDTTAVVGGFNISDEYWGDGVNRGWRDLGLQLTGPLALELAESFDQFFARASLKHKRLQRLRRAANRITAAHNWKLLLSGPGRRHGEVKRTLVKDLLGATSVKLMCAYFLPTWRLRKELMRVAKRGGQVQLILAGKSDVGVSQLAGQKLYGAFLRAGVQIFEYQPQVLHAKLFIVDHSVYAGSSNLDNRSLKINYELLVRVDDPALAADARRIFDADLQHCRQIDPQMWPSSRSFWQKARENLAYFLLARLDPYLARRLFKRLT